MGNDELITNIRRLCRDAIDARFSTKPHHDRVRSQAYLDGYMRALVDTEHMHDAELLQLVGEERRRSV
ncbi:MAG: hypothetical protein OXU20_42375 [Myxococcales bacterium]|nr:hypothetical protein [Myxococcales bacterium]